MTAISGGIGCGKTIVSRIVEAMGYEVYDCDSRAAHIMNNDDGIKRQIVYQVHPEAISPDGVVDRKRLSEIVFSDYDALEKLNAIVHEAVRCDLSRWMRHRDGHMFVETAILYQSGLDKMVDGVWEVEAPVDLRIQRVMMRNRISREQVLARISSQDQYVISEKHRNVSVIINDGTEPILPQVERLIYVDKQIRPY